jgi:hypothetical protein
MCDANGNGPHHPRYPGCHAEQQNSHEHNRQIHERDMPDNPIDVKVDPGVSFPKNKPGDGSGDAECRRRQQSP